MRPTLFLSIYYGSKSCGQTSMFSTSCVGTCGANCSNEGGCGNKQCINGCGGGKFPGNTCDCYGTCYDGCYGGCDGSCKNGTTSGCTTSSCSAAGPNLFDIFMI